MPHVRIDGPCSVQSFWRRFESKTSRDNQRIMKTLSAYSARDASSVLVECVVVEGYLNQSFLVLLSQKEGGILIRLYPGIAVEKSPGVRACIGWLAELVLEHEPDARRGPESLGT